VSIRERKVRVNPSSAIAAGAIAPTPPNIALPLTAVYLRPFTVSLSPSQEGSASRSVTKFHRPWPQKYRSAII